MGHEDETFEEFTARYDRCGMGRRTIAAQRKPIGRLFWGQKLEERRCRSSID